MKKISLLLSLLITISVAFAQKSVIPLPSDSTWLPPSNSFAYALPKTVLNVKVKVAVVKQQRGKYGDFAENMLGITNSIRTNRTLYKINSVEISNGIIPDPDHQYLVTLSDKEMKKWILKKIEIESKNGTLFHSQMENPLKEEEQAPQWLYFGNLVFEEKVENYIDTKIIDGVVTQVPITNTTTITKTLEDEAQEIADFILKIRKDRYELISEPHEYSMSKEALEYTVEQMNKMEATYMELFTGSTVVEEVIEYFTVIPQGEGEIFLFGFSDTHGIVSLQSPFATTIYRLKLDPLVRSSEAIRLVQNNRSTSFNGYRVRTPLSVSVSLYNDDTLVNQFGVFPIFQLNEVQVLQKNLPNFDIFQWGIFY